MLLTHPVVNSSCGGVGAIVVFSLIYSRVIVLMKFTGALLPSTRGSLEIFVPIPTSSHVRHYSVYRLTSLCLMLRPLLAAELQVRVQPGTNDYSTVVLCHF